MRGPPGRRMRRPAARCMHRAGNLRGALIDDPDRVPEGRPVHEPRADRGSAIDRVTELARERPALVHRVHPLADQGRAAAPGTAVTARGALVHPAAEQLQLERFELVQNAVERRLVGKRSR